jgi:hypothetical protein
MNDAVENFARLGSLFRFFNFERGVHPFFFAE